MLTKLLALTFPVFFIALNSVGAQQPLEVSGYSVNWFDNFEGSQIDESKWEKVFSTSPTNFSLHVYLPNNVFTSGGNMVIFSSDQTFGQFDYRSGQVKSITEHRYGRFEARANLPTSRGMWPAIWLVPDQPPLWPSQGEIDIMENRGNEPFLTSSAFHWGTNPPFVHNFVFDENTMTKNGSPVNFHDSFHTYAVEWDPEQIRYYVDGIHYYTVRNSMVGNFMTDPDGQTNPMRLIINNAIGGTFLPNPDSTTQWPQLMEVDYVYVYDRVGEPMLALENGNFDLGSGSLSNWSLFGSNGANVSSDDDHSSSGNSSLKLFGQFFGFENFSGVEQGVSVQSGDTVVLNARALTPAGDSISGTANEVFLKIDFYNTLYGAFGTPELVSSTSLVLLDGSAPDNQWIDGEITTTVPAGAVEARAAIVFRQENNATGAAFVDDVNFENLSATESLNANLVTVLTGSSSDEVTDLLSNDESHFAILAAVPTEVNAPQSEVSFFTTATQMNPSQIEFSIELAANTMGLDYSITAFNFDTSQFEELGNGTTTTNDEVVTVLAFDGNVARFVNDSNGQINYKVSWTPTSPTLFFPWEVRIDQVGWTVER